MNSKKKIKSAVVQDKGVISAKNAESTPKIGIVIPIYNVAKYLRECLDSVANQSYGNFCAVLVNDGSCDDSLQIALDYVAKDSRFVLIDKENGGQSSARNVGIDYFSGDSSLRGESMDSPKQSKQNDLHEVQTESRPIRGAKNRNQGRSSASADFLLESDKRGTPPKSEKAAAFWRVGGAGRGVQPFLRKEKDDNDLIDSKADLSAESCKEIDSNLLLDSRGLDCHESLRDSRNDDIFLDSSATLSPQNDESFVDCFDSALPNLAMTGKIVDCFGDESPRNDAIGANFATSQNLTLYHNAKSTPNPPKIDYIVFLDSDDFWELDLLEKCVDSARITHKSNANPDIIWFDWNEIDEVSGKIQGRTTMELFGFTTQTQISATQWLQRVKERGILQFWWAWKGLIRFDYLRRVNLRFLEGVIFEDNLFGVLLFSQCESIAIVPRKLYNYRIRGGSTTNSTKSLPPFVAPLKAHFSADSEAWAYFCAYSLCEMSLKFADFCANLSDKNRAKLCESAFLPNFLAESCDILAFGSDPLNAKSRFITLLRERGKYSPYLKIIAHIIPKCLKRLRFALFLFYFAPKVAFFRTTRKILKTLRICRG